MFCIRKVRSIHESHFIVVLMFVKYCTKLPLCLKLDLTKCLIALSSDPLGEVLVAAYLLHSGGNHHRHLHTRPAYHPHQGGARYIVYL